MERWLVVPSIVLLMLESTIDLSFFVLTLKFLRCTTQKDSPNLGKRRPHHASQYCSKMVYQTSNNDITKSFRDLIAEGKPRNEVIHAGEDDITKSFRDLIAEGKHNSEVIHAAEDNEDIDIALVQKSSENKSSNSKISSVELTTSTLVAMGFESSHAKKALIDHDGNMNQAIDYLVARSNSNDAANGTNHERDGVAEDLATGSSLSGATTIIADADNVAIIINDHQQHVTRPTMVGIAILFI
jgi:hypothetical protein